MEQRSRSTIVGIQALRFFAALGIVGLHTGKIPGAAMAGVDLFFVISGFIMVVTSDKLFATRGGALTFWRNRAERILPMYWLATLFAVALTPSSDHSWPHVVTSALLLPYKEMPFLVVGWTLVNEAFFYLLFGLALFFTRRPAIIGLAVVMFMLAIVGQWVSNAPIQTYWFNVMSREFAAGALVGLAWLEGWRLPKAVGAVLIAAGIVAFGFLFTTPSLLLISREISFGLPCLAIVAGIVLPNWQPAAKPLSDLFDLLGSSSYALYLTHTTILWILRPYMPEFVNAAIAILFGVVVYLFLEKPLMRLIRSKSRPKKQQQPNPPLLTPVQPGSAE